jgi:flagellar motor switch protein FliM
VTAADPSGVPPTSSSSGRTAGGPRPGGLVTDSRELAGYDFLSPVKLPREHQRTLQLCAQVLAPRLELLFTAQLHVVCRVTPTGVEQLTVEEFVAADPGPVVAAPLTLDPLPGTVAVVLPLVTALTCVDHMLGGSGGAQPQRPLTEIERPLVHALLAATLPDLQGAFAEFVEVQPAFGGLEESPQAVLTVAPAGPAVALTFELAVGEHVGTLSLGAPLQTLLPSLQRHSEAAAVSPGERAARPASHELLTDGLGAVHIDVSVRFCSMPMLSHELAALRPGDLITLDHPVDRPLDIVTGGEVFGHALATRQGTRLACVVVPGVDRKEPSA